MLQFMGVQVRMPTAESSENVNEEKCQRCLKQNMMGVDQHDEARLALELVQSLAEMGEGADMGARWR